MSVGGVMSVGGAMIRYGVTSGRCAFPARAKRHISLICRIHSGLRTVPTSRSGFGANDRHAS
jgi:hypothetical protein